MAIIFFSPKLFSQGKIVLPVKWFFHVVRRYKAWIPDGKQSAKMWVKYQGIVQVNKSLNDYPLLPK